MPTRTTEVRSRGPAERDRTDVRAGRPVPVHHVIARHGDEGLEVLRVPVGGRGATLPVFSAGWAARGYLFAEAPGGGWHVKACGPDELISLLTGPCARVEWVALDPRPGRSGAEAANVMPRENFVDYLLCSRAPLWPRGNEPEATGGDPHGERTIGSGGQEALGEATMLPDPAISRSRAGVLLGCKTKELVRGCSEAAEQGHPRRWHNP